jgi:putative FmdB family regulatory protein
MPTYDYVCEACGHAFEHFQSMSERRLSKCPKCGKARLVRQVGAGAGVIFKGSGFYQTDYKAKASAPKTDAAPGSSKKDAGSDASPAGGSASDAPCAPACGPTASGCAAGAADGGSSKAESKPVAKPEKPAAKK